MPVLMPCEPGFARRVDPVWRRERDALLDAGQSVALLDHDRLERGDAEAALERSALPASGVLAHRGWMVRPEAYAALHRALERRGLRLLTSPEQYRRCHHLPGTLDALRRWSARTVVVPAAELDRVPAALAGFGDAALVIKDYAKSQAGLWDEACFVPRASDIPHAMRVVARFLDLQGDALEGGIVLREFVPLVRDGRGRAVEWRCFVVGGTPLPPFRRDEGAEGVAGAPEQALLRDAAARVGCAFWTMDWAVREAGGHLLLEAGDGGVSGIPEHIDPAPILRALGRLLSESGPVPPGGSTPAAG